MSLPAWGDSIMDFEIISNSAGQTIELGRRLGSQLKGGEIIALCGQLGSGKTQLIKGIADGAGTRRPPEPLPARPLL